MVSVFPFQGDKNTASFNPFTFSVNYFEPRTNSSGVWRSSETFFGSAFAWYHLYFSILQNENRNSS